jgi:hypothetical protein
MTILGNTKAQNMEYAQNNGLILSITRGHNGWARGMSSYQGKSLMYRMQNSKEKNQKVKKTKKKNKASEDKVNRMLLSKSFVPEGYGLKLLRVDDLIFDVCMDWLSSRGTAPSPI